ncbi:MAG TPA: hypothetical protein VJT31_39420 [Rugosimonospora sp.]|nr:hypothetical protein [Rugosimonospora sp.]
MTTPRPPLDLGDIAELAELIEFLDAWLASDHEHLDQSLIRFVGHDSYNIDRLHEDLRRFAVLLDAGPEPSAPPAQPVPDTIDVPF